MTTKEVREELTLLLRTRNLLSQRNVWGYTDTYERLMELLYLDINSFLEKKKEEHKIVSSSTQ